MALRRVHISALVLVPVLLAGSGVGARAATPDVAACIDASERAIAERKEHRLREAAASYLVCAAESCPADIRVECTSAVAEVRRATPTLILGVRDRRGRDVVDVSVRIDDDAPAPVDASALVLDPGPHRFVVAAKGFAPVTRTIVLREGEKERREAFVVGDDAAPAPAVHDPTRRTVGIVVGATGVAALVAGAVLGLRASMLWSDSRTECATATDCTDHPAAVVGHDAALLFATASTIAFVGGAVLVGVGAVVFFTAPLVAPHGDVTGIVLGGRF